MNKRFLFLSGLILAAAISRLIPHPYNFAPIGAMSIFGAAYFTDKKFAFLLPILGLFISDLLINNILYSGYYSSFTLFTPGFGWTYGAMMLIVIAGFFIMKKVNVTRVIGGALSASLIFFIVSNFGVWLSDPDYPLTFSGLILCYDMAIPFFHNTVLGDLVYAGALFGSFELAKQNVPALQKI
ncbi:MAG TPA: hypothetical protein DEQ34_00120 [Balneolaceae bacterium]|nr:hypothetical protein [Balneolaceae bacterium]|tara:strand:- start:57539 stop:58087 length:549 start_codon:yes stop_codon:yes gene_type:complete